MARNEKARTQYLVLGRLRKDTKFQVQYGWFDTLGEAQQTMRQAKQKAKWEHDHKKRKAGSVGGFGVETEYQSDYDVVEIRLYAREVTPWKVMEHRKVLTE